MHHNVFNILQGGLHTTDFPLDGGGLHLPLPDRGHIDPPKQIELLSEDKKLVICNYLVRCVLAWDIGIWLLLEEFLY